MDAKNQLDWIKVDAVLQVLAASGYHNMVWCCLVFGGLLFDV
jgi:hypothetical protein